MTALLDDVDHIGTTVTEARARLRERTAELDQVREQLHQALMSIDEAWSGSHLGYHADLYFEDFVRPSLGQRFDPEWGGLHGLPHGWHDRDLVAVQSIVEERAGVAVDEYVRGAKSRAHEVKEIVTDVAIVVAPIRGMAGLETEVELLDALDGVDLEPSGTFSFPTAMSRDSTAIAEGPRVAPHLQLRQRVLRAARSIQASEEAIVLAERLCRQLGQRLRQQTEPALSASIAETAAISVATMLRRFNEAARALQNRSHGRADFEIGDEYDVQDLIHAILRLHFDDIRTEEWTPSYAGGSSRLDFLLKREQVVVEVKMTRRGLREREVGDQLAIDVARYRAHPDADVLLCFVYDPERRLPNPRGLEDDLAALTDDQLQVAAVIV